LLSVTSRMRPRKMSASRFISSRSLPAARTFTSISSRSMWLPSVRSTTLTISTSLFNCLVICSITSSDPAVTTVMRESVGSSGGDRGSAAIWWPRAENGRETGESAPASFSTRIDRICLMAGASQLFREDHLGEPFAARNHREHVLGLVSDKVEKHQAILLLERFLERPLDVAWLLDLHADVAVGLGKLHEIGKRIHVRLGVAVAVEE